MLNKLKRVKKKKNTYVLVKINKKNKTCLLTPSKKSALIPTYPYLQNIYKIFPPSPLSQ